MSNKRHIMRLCPPELHLAIFGVELESGGQRTARPIEWAALLLTDPTLQHGKDARQAGVIALGKNQAPSQNRNLRTLTQVFRRESVRWNTHFQIQQFPRAMAITGARTTTQTSWIASG
jgi:hypothetical protein